MKLSRKKGTLYKIFLGPPKIGKHIESNSESKWVGAVRVSIQRSKLGGGGKVGARAHPGKKKRS